MRKIFLFVLIAFGFCSEAQDVDVHHYQYLVMLDDKNDTINILATIQFRYLKTGPVSFDLKNMLPNGRGMKIIMADLLSDFGKKTKFSHLNDKLTVDPGNIQINDSDDLLVRYKGIPADGLIIAKNKFGERTFFADNWPNRAHHWLVCNDRPDDKASFTFIVDAPKHYAVISNGIKVTDTVMQNGNRLTTWQEKTPLPTKVMVIGAARFATKTYDNSPKDVPVSAWVYPQDSTKGFYDYALAPDILKFFSDYIAPFPYKKLANVQSKTIFGGMENASAIFYAENSVTGDRSSEDLLAHEIAHQWFGDMASEKSFAHLWLSEGFATFLTNYYWEKKYGVKAAAERWKEDRDKIIAFSKTSNAPVVDSTKNLMSLLNANSYQKGAWVLRMLQQEVGDSVFQKIIQTYYNTYKGGNAETRDFEAVAEKVSGKELTWFFDQWLYRKETPKLSVRSRKTPQGLKLQVKQLQQRVFKFTLPVSVESNGNVRMLYLNITKDEESFLVGQDRDKIVIDPKTELLFEAN